MKILVTGAAGFIGSKIAHLLALRGDEVVGIDNLNDYYDLRLKWGHLRLLGIETERNDFALYGEYHSRKFDKVRFIPMSLDDRDAMVSLFAGERFDKVVNLAAQAGVRYSIENPYAYLQSNIVGFLNLLECCRHYPVEHLLFASSSSVYGLNAKAPFSEDAKVDCPVSFYAATKKSDELMAYAYSKLYNIPATGLRYFTVYGPWGRPDMSPMLFADAITHEHPIKVFNNGDMIRDFTYIDDIANGSVMTLDKPPVAAECPNGVPFKVFNIGCSHPVKLMDFIAEIENALGKKAKMEMLPMQPGDVYMTCADTTKLECQIGYKPKVELHEGISRFIDWYQSPQNPLRSKM